MRSGFTFCILFLGSILLIGLLGRRDAVGAAAPKHNPLVRLLAPAGEERLAAQLDSLDTPAALEKLIAGLQSQHMAVPQYLLLVRDEYRPMARETATFAVGCYWEGERDLGKLPGIVATRTGTIGSDEVVEAEYDPAKVDFKSLVSRMGRKSCFRKVYARTDGQQQAATAVTGAVERSAAMVQPAEQQQFDLSQHPDYYYLPLTALQATKLNSALASDGDAQRFLSPRQRTMHDRLAKVLDRHKSAADHLSDLRPDRSRKGLADYLRQIEARIGVIERYYPYP
jgi:hypothetical protein